jgi:hypothetical protein
MPGVGFWRGTKLVTHIWSVRSQVHLQAVGIVLQVKKINLTVEDDGN